MGDTGILLLGHWLDPAADKAARLEALIAGNIDHPARELMWGAPGTMLAALHLHRSTGEPRWAELYCATARRLWSQLLWSEEHQCHYWMQDLYGEAATYLDAVHGFVATAAALIAGRDLMDAREWKAWERGIVNTVRRTASREGGLVNWRPWLDSADDSTCPQKMLMQFCHGAPGFVVCLAGLPHEPALDGLLDAAGRATWAAGPLRKGSNLCHGTAGNGYAFLKLYERSGQAHWLDKARAFAMHAIAQAEAAAARHGQLRYSLWTGDPGLAIYLWDCLRGRAEFPTLDVFYGRN
jgi:lantibiotic modifying enzyme